MIVYAETGIGCCLREAKTVEADARAILRDVGERARVQLCRKATDRDIGWVRAMGGYVPEAPR